MTLVVALVPAKDRADSVGETVTALLALDEVDRVIVIDDGSQDDTAAVAVGHGAGLVRLDVNVGKGRAVAAGVAAAPDATVYLLIDADVRGTSALAGALLSPVLAGEADLVIGVLPPAGRKGGFGLVRDMARWGIARGCGMQCRAPLSGQRAVRADLLRSLVPAERFGFEVGMTIDAVRSGARVLEVDVSIEHRHTGRRLTGFRHRGAQGVDITRALWPRLTSGRTRVGLMVLVFLTACVAALLAGSGDDAAAVPLPAGVQKVVLFAVPGLSWDEVGSGRMPVLDELIATGAIAATNVRTVSDAPKPVEGYATLNAGVRVAVDGSGGATATRAAASPVGALGDALHAAGLRTAVVGQASATAALADGRGVVDHLVTGPELREAGDPPGGLSDRTGVAAAVDAALRTADVVLVDPGDLDRHPQPSSPGRAAALARTDAILGDVRRALPADALLMVVSVVPPASRSGADPWALTPTVIAGPGVPAGSLSSASTHRGGLVTLTDVAPTILTALGVDVPGAMVGRSLAVDPGPVDVAALATMNRDATYRQRIYLPLTIGYVVVQVVVYGLGAAAALWPLTGRPPLPPTFRRHLAFSALAVVAYPLATFAFRAVQLAGVRTPGVPVLLALTVGAALVAGRARRGPLAGLSWLLGATIVLLLADLCTGARLQASSLLGYAIHTSGRFSGSGNTTFAILLCSAVLLAALHLRRAPRRGEALFSAGLLFAAVALVQGAPGLGADVGGIITMVPVFGLTLWVLAGRSLSLPIVVAALVAATLALLVAAGVDATRPVADRTHLGRLVEDVRRDGLAPLWSTVTRRLRLNFGADPAVLSALVLGLAGGLLVTLRTSRTMQALVPHRSALRVGVVAAVGGSVLGYLVNDSGVVVVAMSFVFVGPLLTLLALQPLRSEMSARS